MSLFADCLFLFHLCTILLVPHKTLLYAIPFLLLHRLSEDGRDRLSEDGKDDRLTEDGRDDRLKEDGREDRLSEDGRDDRLSKEGWSMWNGNGSSWLVLHFQVLVDSIDLTRHHVAKSSHLAANMMTDRQTDWQTKRVMGEETEYLFFKGIIKSRNNRTINSYG